MPIKLEIPLTKVMPNRRLIHRAHEPFTEDEAEYFTPDDEDALVIESDPSADFYVDLTADDNRTYYYMIKYEFELYTVWSSVFPAANFPNTGPGLKKPIRGDFRLGYFGKVSNEEFISKGPFLDLLGLPEYDVPTTELVWEKLAINDKIIYLPVNFYIPSISPLTVYRAGRLFGTNDTTKIPTDLYDNDPGNHVDQLRPTVIADYDFIIRSPRATKLPSSPGPRETNNEILHILGGCYYRTNKVDTEDYRVGTLLGLIPPTGVETAGAQFSIICSSASTNNEILTAGFSTLDSWGGTAVTASSANLLYYPILELKL